VGVLRLSGLSEFIDAGMSLTFTSMTKAELLEHAPDLLLELALNVHVSPQPETGKCKLCWSDTPNLAICYCPNCASKVLLVIAAHLQG
jgi:Zn finger protein HypA/HybF involved in hydrogenase expression